MTDSRVDAYLAGAQPFARPILRRLRAAVHRACPDVTETIKWGFPHFDYKGMFCSMAAFKAHCSFGFWKHGLLARQGLVQAKRDGMGSIQRLRSMADLPRPADLERLLRAAKALNDDGVSVRRPARRPKPPVRVPRDVVAALGRQPRAADAFAALRPSHRREYVEWVVAAKAAETRTRRITKMLAQLAEGHTLNRKYERARGSQPAGLGRS